MYAGFCRRYWELRFAGAPVAREHVAGALNHYGIPTRSRTGDTTWTGYEIAERVKQYETRFFAKRKPDREYDRRFLAEKWSKTLYYPINWLEAPYKPDNRGSQTTLHEDTEDG